MIRYTLICPYDHEFEAWFRNSADYDKQALKALVICPVCSSTKTRKALMTPGLSRKGVDDRKKEKLQLFMKKHIEKAQKHIAKHYDDVGGDFATEARAMHEGEKPHRNIYGQVTAEEGRALMRDGVKSSVLPEAFIPLPKNKIH